MSDAEATPVERRSLTPALLHGSLSNYLLLALQLVLGVALTRVLFLGLSREEYGFWSLLWSIFGWALVLDFGFGVAMVKYASQARTSGDWPGLVRRLNSVFVVSCAMAALIALASVALAPVLEDLLRIEGPASRALELKAAFVLFGLGTALVFPLGIFSEVLTGLGRIPVRNAIRAAASLANFGLLTFVVRRQLGLPAMVVAALSVGLATNLAMVLLVWRLVPGFRLHPRSFDPALLRSTLSFSVFAYLVTLSGLVTLRLDQLLIASLLSVALVAPYQVAWRLSEIFRQLSTQMLEALGPVASMLFAATDHDRLRYTLFASTRAVAFLATLLFVVLAVYLGPLLKLWLELDDPEARLCGWLLLLATYVSVVLKGPSSQVLLMSQQEQALARATLIEAAANLGLSVVLCTLFGWGIVGVALGTLIPTLLMSLFVYVPLTGRFVGRSSLELLRVSFRPVAAPAAFAVIVSVAILAWAPPDGLISLALRALPGIGAYVLVFAWTGLSRDERRGLRAAAHRR